MTPRTPGPRPPLRRVLPPPERLSEYFAAERAAKYVKRFELLAILTQFHKAERQNRFYSRFWRWLKAPRGSGGVHAVEPPKKESTS